MSKNDWILVICFVKLWTYIIITFPTAFQPREIHILDERGELHSLNEYFCIFIQMAEEWTDRAGRWVLGADIIQPTSLMLGRWVMMMLPVCHVSILFAPL